MSRKITLVDTDMLKEEKDTILNETAEDIKNLAKDTAPTVDLFSAGTKLQLTDCAEKPVKELVLYGKTTQEAEPEPSNPQMMSGLESDKVNVCGENILPFPYATESCVKYGVNFTVNTDASITITGTSLSNGFIRFLLRTGSLPKGKYSFKCLGLPDDCNANIYQVGSVYGETEKQFTVSDESKDYSVGIDVPNGTTVDATLKPMLVFGESVGEYVPQKGGKAAIQPDGELYALPVTDGGNYTDENSRQWICDTAEFDTENGGKLVRRVKMFEVTEEFLNSNKYAVSDISRYTGTKDTVTNFRIFHQLGTDKGAQSMCSHLKRCENLYKADEEGQYCQVADSVDIALSYDTLNITSEADSSERVEACKSWMNEQAANGTPLTFIVELRENEESNLSDEETEEFSKLQTYSSATNIFTDNVGGVGVCYVADTKKYIDNKFEELKSAILSMGGNV
jgi:hypothetical protein